MLGWSAIAQARNVPLRHPDTSTTGEGDASKLDLRVGLILKAEKHPEAEKLYVEQVDLVGLSFGGRVVMQLAAGWPERVRRMVVGGTSAGGEHHIPSQVDAHSTLRALSDGDAETWAEKIAPLLFGRAYAARHPERLYSLARWRARHPVNPVGIARQWEAWDSFALGDQISTIDIPTMVLHGTDDAISPVENAHALATLLPNARLHLMEGVGHSPNVESPDGFNQVIKDFLESA